MGQIILTAAVTCAVTVVVSFLINTILTAPKKQKERRESELSTISADLQGLRCDLQKQATQNHEDLKTVKAGLQAVLKNELKVRYFKWLELGYAPEDAKDDLERMYTAYHNLGANGVMDKHRERFLNLPEEPIKERR